MKYKKYKVGDKVIVPNGRPGVIGESIRKLCIVNYIKALPGEKTYNIFYFTELKPFIAIGEQLEFEFMRE